MKHRFARLATSGVCIALVGGALTTAVASASPINDKKAQAQELQAQIEANGETVSGNTATLNDILWNTCGASPHAYISLPNESHDVAPSVALDLFVYTPEEFTAMAETNPFVRRALASGRVVYAA